MSYLQDNKPITITKLLTMHADGEKIAVLTAYDSTMCALLNRCGVEVILVGDSLGNVVQGHSSTTPVTLEEMAYHTECVARANTHAFLIADLPFASYGDPVQALESSALLMRAGADMVKLEGGRHMASTVRFLVERGVPVCAHIGLTPQSVNALGGYRVQGSNEEAALILREDAHALEEAGAALVVLEMIPAALARDITSALKTMATIGIGAGVDCDGQVLVLHDMIGVYPGKKPRFTKDFMAGAPSIEAAVKAYVDAVKASAFPGQEHSY